MMIVNSWWLAAGLLCIFSAFLHLISGQKTIVTPFFSVSMDKMVKGVLFACWHMVTIILFSSALVLLWGGFKPIHNSLVLVISAQFVLFAVGFVLISSSLFPGRNWLALPQSLLLMPVGLLGIAGVIM